MLCLSCIDKVGNSCKAGMEMNSSMTDSSICGSYKPISESQWEPKRKKIDKMTCLSCGSIFARPIVLEDGAGSSIQVCPKCRSTDLELSDGFYVPAKEALK